jgi:uncharacterized Zn finger protein (UPF0148 family)
MFCEKCGYENKDDALFCENCGQQINKEETINLLESDDAEAVVATEIQETAEIQETSTAEKIEGIQETEEIRETRKYDETTEEQTTIISKNITGSSTGSYSWMYEFSLWKNPAVLITVFKVSLIALMVPVLLMFFLTLRDGVGEAFKLLLSMLGIGFVLMIVLMVAAYVMLSIAYGGKYYVLFKMDKKGVNHIQLDKQHKKAQALGFLTALIGLSSGNISAAGAGLLGASKKSSYTNFKKVKSVKFRPRMDTIYLNESLNKNQVYAEKEDYLFIKDFILENCSKNVKIIEK